MQIIALAIFSFIFVAVYIAVHFLFRKRNLVSKALIAFIGTIAIIVLSIYAFSPKNITYSDPELAPLWKAINEVDREGMGFTPISKDSKIKIERANGRTYDVMLHIYKSTSRTIAFKKKNEEFIWIGEQEAFKGPGKHETPDGNFNERIVLTYDKERISGYPTNVLNISYTGEDTRLSLNRDLTLEEILPILKEWKYKVQPSAAPDAQKAARP
jgi:hypothetical protein